MDQILKNIINSIPGCWYVRATDDDANIIVDELDATVKILCIYNNLATINNVASQGRFSYREWPIEINILSLSELDANTEEGDAIRATLIPVADAIYDKLPDVTEAPPVDGYEIELLNQVKIYDKILTGVRLSLTYNLGRNIYVC